MGHQTSLILPIVLFAGIRSD